MKIVVSLLFIAAVLVGCNSGWSDTEKNAYLDACKNATEMDLNEYCDCTLEKLMVEAPNPNDVDKVDMDKITGPCLESVGLKQDFFTLINLGNTR